LDPFPRPGLVPFSCCESLVKVITRCGRLGCVVMPTIGGCFRKP
jgi:hypothetical protein